MSAEARVLLPDARAQFQHFHERPDVIHDDMGLIEGNFAPYTSTSGIKYKLYSENRGELFGNTGFVRIFEVNNLDRMELDRPVLELDVQFNEAGDLVGLQEDQFHAIYRDGQKEYLLRYSVDKDEPQLAYLSHVLEIDMTNQIAASVLTSEQIQSLRLREKGFANRTAWTDLLMQYVQGNGVTGESIDSHLIQGLAYTRQDLQRFSQEKMQLPEGVIIEELVDKTERRIPLTRTEIFGLVNTYVAEGINDDQMAQWITAVYDHGLSLEETIDLTMAMAASGKVLDLASLSPDGKVADKHSSGGVGDKTTPVVAALVAACDIKFGKMSGPGLGHTGGTTDKLLSIPGFRTELTDEEFSAQVRDHGIVVAGQSASLAPADKKIYALRNQINKIDSIPLIASSIMSKKIAAGANVLVLDVTVGKGAFMKTLQQAEELAGVMVDIGKSLGMKVNAELTNMDNPRGYMVGNALEVQEAVEILQSNVVSESFYTHSIDTAAQIVFLAGKAETIDQAKEMVREVIHNGKALDKFREMIVAQGGDPAFIDDFSLLPQAPIQEWIEADEDGWVSSIDALAIGEAVMELGGGRRKKEDPINYAVGVKIGFEVGGDFPVAKGAQLFEIHAQDEESKNRAVKAIREAIKIGKEKPEKPPIVYKLIE